MRAGRLRRELGIPNPVPFYALCRTLLEEISVLLVHTERSAISSSAPTIRAKGRAISPKLPYSELVLLRARHRATKRYLLRADISQFYHSIYTHIVPWALHGKVAAKADKKGNTLGNRLDRCLRICQDKQTVGIPIGPDTSLLTAEVILSAIDTQFAKMISPFQGYRYVDDYELCFRTLSEAESALAALQQCLLEYELRLNPTKTAILELPQPLEPRWTSELRSFQFRGDNQRSEESDLIHYFDVAFQFSSNVPEESILKYAVARLSGRRVRTQNFKLFQSLLWHVAVVEPGALRDVLEVLLEYELAGVILDLDLMEEAVNEIIERHATLGHDSEVTWALWAVLRFNLGLREGAARAVSKVDDCFAAILALDVHSRGKAPMMDLSLWASCMRDSELFDRQWLLSYEANVKNWLPSIGSLDHVSKDSIWSFLKALKVSFYHPVTAKAKLPTARRRTKVAVSGTQSGGNLTDVVTLMSYS